MTTPDDSALVLYAEPGSSMWPVLWGPAFALIGALVELASGPVHVLAWVVIGIVLAGLAMVWVSARRRVCAVRLTTSALTQGRESLDVAKLAEVDDVGASIGSRVLGGGWSVPRKFTEVPVKLDDGSTVLAWARDGDALREALSRLLAARDR
jgi:hypothetical protein